MIEKKVALITGANGGIGYATAEVFAKNNYNLVVNYFNNSDNVINLLNSYGEENVFIYKSDVRNFDEIKKLVELGYKKFRRLDTVINTAGIIKDKTFSKMSVENWKEVIDVNLNGTFNVIKATIDILAEQGCGSIINISSIIGETGNFGQTNYSASKAAIFGLTKSLAKEMGAKGITINSIAPGFVDTHMTENIPLEIRKKILEKIPLKRFATPIEIAEIIFFISQNKYITGSIIDINGGLSSF